MNTKTDQVMILRKEGIETFCEPPAKVPVTEEDVRTVRKRLERGVPKSVGRLA